ncbi:MAG: hypothetical protein SF162_14240 [bacterium]|nr:hypothetical protein [bacterium]
MSAHAAPPFNARNPESLDQLLNRAARVLRIGAWVNGIAAGLLLVIGALGAVGVIPGVFAALHRALLLNGAGAADAGVAAAILLILFNMSLLLVAMVGALAREAWMIPALVLVGIGNAAALIVWGFTPALITIGFCAAALGVSVREGGAARKAFRLNPVMIKELRGRMRGVRAFVVLTVYLGLMGGLAMMLYLVYSTAGRDPGSAAAGEIGRVLFNGVFAVELVLIVFIAPAFTAGAITGERERQTYDLLRTTLLSGASFVIGKLESALGYIVLLLAAGIPLQAFAFLFGGVTEGELILSLVILLVTAVALGTIGIYFSAGNSRTLAASVRAYTVTLILLFVAPSLATILLGIVRGLLFGAGGLIQSAPLEAVIVYVGHLLTSINPLATAINTQNLLVTQQVSGFYAYTLAANGSTIPLAAPWIVLTILYLAGSAVLMALTIRAARLADEHEPEPAAPPVRPESKD